MYDQDYEYDEEAYYAQSYQTNASPMNNNASPTSSGTTMTNTVPSEEKITDWDAEAQLPYKKVIISGRKRFLPTQVIKGELNDLKSWSLQNNGRIFLSLSGGDLILESGDKNDFLEILKVLEENRKELECPSSKHSKGKKDRTKLSRVPRDLIKSMRIYDATSNCNLGTELVMEFHNIPAFKNEITRSTLGNVSMTFMPGTLTSKPSEHVILDRSISNLSVAFQKRFPGVTLANVDKTIANIRDTHCLVPKDGPVAFFHNRDLPDDQKVVTVIKAAGLEQIELTKAQTDAAVAIVKEKIGKNISSGNATGDAKISIYAPPTQDRLEEDFAFKAGDKKAMPFFSFADAFHALPDGSEKEHDQYLSTYKYLYFKLEMLYYPDQL